MARWIHPGVFGEFPRNVVVQSGVRGARGADDRQKMSLENRVNNQMVLLYLVLRVLLHLIADGGGGDVGLRSSLERRDRRRVGGRGDSRYAPSFDRES